MAQLLKRTKKSCLKFFRKFTSSSKPSAAKLEEENCGSRPIHKNVDSNDESHCDIPLKCPYTISSNVTSNRNQNKISSPNRNCSSSSPEAKKSTNFIVSSNYANKLDEYLTTALHTINPSLMSCDVRGVRSFRLLSEEDAARNVQDENATRRYSTEIVFEKVRYRDNIRYFRRTPSNTSLSSHTSTPKAVHSNKTPGNVLNERKLNNNGNNTYPKSLHSNIYLQFRNNISHPVNLTLTSNPTSNLNNLVISEGRNWLNEPCPMVTWDINGNSIDDDIVCLNSNWDDYDNRLNMLRDKRLLRNRSDGSYKSSSKSSSTTLETWVDDEILDNSFNEEIEKQFRI